MRIHRTQSKDPQQKRPHAHVEAAIETPARCRGDAVLGLPKRQGTADRKRARGAPAALANCRMQRRGDTHSPVYCDLDDLRIRFVPLAFLSMAAVLA